MSINKIYAGIGSRETPDFYLDVIKVISQKLYKDGYTLRTGGAPGADYAFEKALFDFNPPMVQNSVEIYLPWPSFNSERYTYIHPTRFEPQEEAFAIAEQFHPGWKYLKHGARKLHARNVHQIIGPDVKNPIPVDFVVCWTKNAKRGGGTGQALRIAEKYKIKIYDLANEQDYIDILEFVIGL